MNEEYEYTQDLREERRSIFGNLGNIPIAIWVILFALIAFIFYLLRASNANINDYLILGGVLVVIIIIMSKKKTSEQIGYISFETAKQLLIAGLKSHNKLRKDGICKVSLPRGEVEIGLGIMEINPRPYDAQMWLSWMIGFSVYDEDDNNNLKHFLSRIDPLIGSRGIIGIEESKGGPFKGIPEKWVFKPLAIPVEDYAKMYAKGYIDEKGLMR